MDRKQIFDKLKEILSFSFSDSSEILDKCSESSNLITDLGLNSVGMLFMVISIEGSAQAERVHNRPYR